MVGVPKFNRTEVLLNAGREFANRGYEGTSVSQLVTATGLLRGSLYGAFGSKAELFQLAFASIAEHDDSDTTIDLLTVALRERAQDDPVVAMLAHSLLTTLNGGSMPASERIFERLVGRAGIAINPTN